MANMTRTQMRSELKSHGWSRFADADLDRYLDWALQTTYGEGAFNRSVRTETTVPNVTSDRITFAAITGDTAETLQRVEQVMVKEVDGMARKLKYANDRYFNAIMRPNLDTNTPLISSPSYYYVWDLNVVLYPKPNNAITVIVDFNKRKDAFESDSAVSGLPERFDKIVIAWAEVFCHRRARETQEMATMQASARDMMLRELGQEEMVAAEGTGRSIPWGT